MKRLWLILILSYSVVFAQSEDMDFQFKKIKSPKESKLRFHLVANGNLTTIVGSDATAYREDIETERQRLGLDIFRINIYPGAQVGVVPHLALSNRINLLFGLKYQQLGWSEIARRRLNSSNYYRYNLKNHFHYVSIPLGFQFSISEGFHISVEQNVMFLAGSKVSIREVLVVSNQKDVDKRKEDFEDLYGVTPQRFVSNVQLGFHINLTENIIFNTGAGITSSFLKNSVNFKFINTFAGVTFKL